MQFMIRFHLVLRIYYMLFAYDQKKENSVSCHIT